MTAPRRALVVVDAQQEYFTGILQIQAPPREESLTNIVAAMDVAAEHDLPVIVVQHQEPAGSPVFAEGSESWALHPEVERRLKPSYKRLAKSYSSVVAGNDLAAWLAEQNVDTITIAGYMTNNCDIASAVSAEELGLATEILSDATGAIHLANDAGKVSADQLHETLMVMLHCNFAAVATTDAWSRAVKAGKPLPKSDLGTSATQGVAAFAG